MINVTKQWGVLHGVPNYYSILCRVASYHRMRSNFPLKSARFVVSWSGGGLVGQPALCLCTWIACMYVSTQTNHIWCSSVGGLASFFVIKMWGGVVVTYRGTRPAGWAARPRRLRGWMASPLGPRLRAPAPRAPPRPPEASATPASAPARSASASPPSTSRPSPSPSPSPETWWWGARWARTRFIRHWGRRRWKGACGDG